MEKKATRFMNIQLEGFKSGFVKAAESPWDKIWEGAKNWGLGGAAAGAIPGFIYGYQTADPYLDESPWWQGLKYGLGGAAIGGAAGGAYGGYRGLNQYNLASKKMQEDAEAQLKAMGVRATGTESELEKTKKMLSESQQGIKEREEALEKAYGEAGSEIEGLYAGKEQLQSKFDLEQKHVEALKKNIGILEGGLAAKNKEINTMQYLMEQAAKDRTRWSNQDKIEYDKIKAQLTQAVSDRDAIASKLKELETKPTVRGHIENEFLKINIDQQIQRQLLEDPSLKQVVVNPSTGFPMSIPLNVKDIKDFYKSQGMSDNDFYRGYFNSPSKFIRTYLDTKK